MSTQRRTRIWERRRARISTVGRRWKVGVGQRAARGQVKVAAPPAAAKGVRHAMSLKNARGCLSVPAPRFQLTRRGRHALFSIAARGVCVAAVRAVCPETE